MSESYEVEENFDISLISNEFDFDESDHIDLKDYKPLQKGEICLHPNSSNEGGVEVCTDCGIEIYKELSLEPEWRYYGDNDSKHSSDPSRCHIRKVDEKNIYKDIEKCQLTRSITDEANNLYSQVTQGKIRRGNFRKSVIFACVFNAYKYQGNSQIPDELQSKFSLTKKEISKGLNYFNLQMNKKMKPVYISPINFIPKIMKRFNSNDHHISQVENLYKKIHNKSTLINRSNPQSVISSLVYYYCRLIGGDISCSKFSDIVKLSDITISRLSKNISEILGTIDTVKLN